MVKYKSATDKNMKSGLAAKLKIIKNNMLKADNALKNKISKMPPEKKSEFMSKKAKIIAQMKERSNFK